MKFKQIKQEIYNNGFSGRYVLDHQPLEQGELIIVDLGNDISVSGNIHLETIHHYGRGGPDEDYTDNRAFLNLQGCKSRIELKSGSLAKRGNSLQLCG